MRAAVRPFRLLAAILYWTESSGTRHHEPCGLLQAISKLPGNDTLISGCVCVACGVLTSQDGGPT